MDPSFPPNDKGNKGIVKFLHEVENIKRLPRAGWVLKGIPSCESVADHSHRLSVMGFLAEPNLDRVKIIMMGVVHDLEEKHEKENLFFEWLRTTLPGNVALEMKDLWQEYEDRETPEAKWLYDADKFESVVQAEEYGSRGYQNLQEFMGLISKFKSRQIIGWANELLDERQRRQISGRYIPIIFVIGSSNIDISTHCKRLSTEIGGLYACLSDILEEKSLNDKDHEADFAKLYLEKGLDTSPSGFMIDLLKDKVDDAIREEKRCVILYDFPRTIQQLRGFEEKVQRENLTLFLTCSADVARDELRAIESHLGDHFKKIICDGSGEDVLASLKEVTEAFIEPASVVVSHGA